MEAGSDHPANRIRVTADGRFLTVVFLKSAIYRKIINTVRTNKEVYNQIKEDIKNDPRKAFNINTILLWVVSNSADMSEILQKVLLEYKPKLILNKLKNGSQ